MNRPILMCALLLVAAVACGAQQASPSGAYEGTSSPPPDDTIVTMTPAAPKPSPARPALVQPASAPAVAQGVAQPAAQSVPQPTSVDPSLNYPAPDAEDGTDNGIVRVASDVPSQSSQPVLNQRMAASDPDGDIVHPGPLPPGQLGEGTMIRVRLLSSLSTAYTQRGDRFRTRVASDVLQSGQVLIPAGSEIDGTVVQVSTGRMGGHGSMHLRPETVVLPDGSRFRIYAQTTGTPGSPTRVNGEGTIAPGSRVKKDSIEYGGTVGAGAVTGAVLGGPAGALAGGLVGAGLITAHLLVSHPQAALEPGTTLLFALTEPLNLVPARASGN